MAFPGGASYRTVVGEEDGSTPVWIGVQVSPPGYSTGTHSHPYMEVVSVIEGTGEAWMEGQPETVPIGPRDGGLSRVAGGKHTPRAVHLDSLVVAVARTARVGDGAQLASDSAQRRRCRIDVAAAGITGQRAGL